MNPSLIAIISIITGIVATNIFALCFKKYSFNFIGNTIIGVFGSIFFTKIVGRFGIQPFEISKNNDLNLYLFIAYLVFSLFGAILFLIIAKKIVNKINN